MSSAMAAAAEPILAETDFASIPGWLSVDHQVSLETFGRSCA
jgi:hypothetical protein